MNLSLQLLQKYSITGVFNRKVLNNAPFDMIQRDFFAENTVDEVIRTTSPDVIVHCAAMANIDSCEKNPELARRINGEIPGELADRAKKLGIRMIHISTDAVFDGIDCGKDGYKEDDRTNPNNVYAQTKLLGERSVQEQNPDALVVRVNFFGWSASQTRSLGELFYHNLVQKKPMMGFKDVFFCTLYVQNLVDILDQMLEKQASGLYHVFSSDYQSKYSFGISIAERFGMDASLISPVSWKEGGLAAKRSPNLIMNTDKLRNLFGTALPTQKECLERFYQSFEAGLPEKVRILGS
jgi:dTDP-4-dehydrorhamnose reductase